MKSKLPRLITAILSIAVFSSSALPVFADNDDEYITLNDINRENAYIFWRWYGLTGDTSSSYNISYATTGTESLTGTFTVNESGSIGGTSLIDLAMAWQEAFDTNVGNNVTLPHSLFDLHVEASSVAGTTRQSSYACRAIPDGTPVNQDQPYTIQCNAVVGSYNGVDYDVSTANTGTITLISHEQATVSHETGDVVAHWGMITTDSVSGDSHHSMSTNLTEVKSGGGGITQTATINLTTTTTQLSKMSLALPILKGDISVGVPDRSIIYFRSTADNPYIIAYKQVQGNTITELKNSLKMYGYQSNEELTNYTIDVDYRQSYGAYVFIKINTNNINGKLGFNEDASNTVLNVFKTGIIPLYADNLNNMDDDLYRLYMGQDRTINAINEASSAIQSKLDKSNQLMDTGNENTGNSIGTAMNQNIHFNDTKTKYQNLENAQIVEMDNNIDAINTSPDLISNSKFLTSANWVTLQFNRLVMNTPIELVLMFSMTLGLALVFIGKLR